MRRPSARARIETRRRETNRRPRRVPAGPRRTRRSTRGVHPRRIEAVAEKEKEVKASSTLDSMLGYRSGRLRWLGTAGARLDDLLTWIPCRLVMISLPLVSRTWRQWFGLVKAAERDGADDPSPNAGRSEAIYAHCIGICMGGENSYGSHLVRKPVLAVAHPQATEGSVLAVLVATTKLETAWIGTVIVIGLAMP